VECRTTPLSVGVAQDPRPCHLSDKATRRSRYAVKSMHQQTGGSVHRLPVDHKFYLVPRPRPSRPWLYLGILTVITSDRRKLTQWSRRSGRRVELFGNSRPFGQPDQCGPQLPTPRGTVVPSTRRERPPPQRTPGQIPERRVNSVVTTAVMRAVSTPARAIQSVGLIGLRVVGVVPSTAPTETIRTLPLTRLAGSRHGLFRCR